ncbi:HtaA domain-containing protein [Phenylobacterium sp. NIBR 498073]|uniref:HtaA domain-containing protein n=1 Tax=Phenylobacterium sp. NIBR 498073 TaxID=3015177 RepID=UPI0022B3893C|nr:HtaA domain-containing protein [Phenylobacterium sp. NIBR 498073]MBS0490186.1 HtaA domain-containing protein [Pseudomonadota bacterium]WGU42045.1 HtaA domain-containing protein [Phenylobacterium sp. NIBR 498073]
MSDQIKPATSLQWGVKQSFRNYVGMAGGTTEVGAGAQQTEDGAFVFAAADGDLALDAEGKLQGRGGFTGEVKFQAHGGMLSVFLADPAIEVDDKGAALTVADTAKRDYRVEVARLDLAAMTTEPSGEIVIPVGLSVEGSRLLGDHYAPRTELDPVRLRLG